MPRTRKLSQNRSTPGAVPFADDQNRAIVWTHCLKCGDVWTTRAITPKGKCPFCRGKVKIQKAAF